MKALCYPFLLVCEKKAHNLEFHALILVQAVAVCHPLSKQGRKSISTSLALQKKIKDCQVGTGRQNFQFCYLTRIVEWITRTFPYKKHFHDLWSFKDLIKQKILQTFCIFFVHFREMIVCGLYLFHLYPLFLLTVDPKQFIGFSFPPLILETAL